MMMTNRVLLLLLLTTLTAAGQSLVVNPSEPVAKVSPNLYGLMTEEINYSYDGGLYAEMVQNRAFNARYPRLAEWNVVAKGGSVARFEGKDSGGPSKALEKCAELTITSVASGSEAGIANAGFWGMLVSPSTGYEGSFWARPSGVGNATARLVDNQTGKVLAQTGVPMTDGAWKQYKYLLKTDSDVTAGKENHLEIVFAKPGTISFQLVSLFPPTYHNRSNGNRPDLMKLMAAMNPHFLRLPGGNYLEGDYPAERFNWKETIGPLVDRPTHRSPWNYRSSDGMGLLEFLEWTEDLHIDPVLAVYAGYSLKGDYIVGDALKPYVQDVMDEIEYVTGPTSTRWGAERVKDGHPKPFPLHYIEIGNEDWFDKSGSYDERFTQIANAIRAKYGKRFELIATTPVKKGNPDVIDDHYYATPEEFFDKVHKYDTVDRSGPKIFIGEWATRTGSPTTDFGAALGDAAWMTSMERNSDLIVMASYAPLFVNVNSGAMQWASDLIGYDAQSAYGSPSYWAQVMFSKSLGEETVKSSTDLKNSRFFWSATVSKRRKILFLKMVNASDEEQHLSLQIAGNRAEEAKVSTLHAATRFATNSITNPHVIEPVKTTIGVPAGEWNYVLPGNTIQVLEIPLR